MRFAITIKAEEADGAGALLLQVAIALRQQRIQPDSILFNAATGKPVVDVWILVSRDEIQANALAEFFRDVPGTKAVKVLPWDESQILPKTPRIVE